MLIRTAEFSPVWAEIFASPETRFECPVMYRTTSDGCDQLTEGVIDVVIRSDKNDGPDWTIIDWKTDACDETEWIRRSAAYRRQIQSYKSITQTLTGVGARSRLERV